MAIGEIAQFVVVQCIASDAMRARVFAYKTHTHTVLFSIFLEIKLTQNILIEFSIQSAENRPIYPVNAPVAIEK